MRPEPNNLPDRYRIVHPTLGESDNGCNYGCFEMRRAGANLKVIASDGRGWDHVSVSLKDRCPTWPEMDFVKRLFWSDDETVIQFHPKQSEYVNNCQTCLHMWKKQGAEHELPPSFLTGVK